VAIDFTECIVLLQQTDAKFDRFFGTDEICESPTTSAWPADCEIVYLCIIERWTGACICCSFLIVSDQCIGSQLHEFNLFLDYDVIVLFAHLLRHSFLERDIMQRTLLGTRKRRSAWLNSITELMKMNVEKVQSNSQQN